MVSKKIQIAKLGMRINFLVLCNDFFQHTYSMVCYLKDQCYSKQIVVRSLFFFLFWMDAPKFIRQQPADGQLSFVMKKADGSDLDLKRSRHSVLKCLVWFLWTIFFC